MHPCFCLLEKKVSQQRARQGRAQFVFAEDKATAAIADQAGATAQDQAPQKT